MKSIQRFLQESSDWDIPMNQLVKDATWQKLREELVGTWAEYPVENCRKLDRYLQPYNNIKKLRIVMNYLTGTGFRTGRIKHPSITKLRNKISNAMKKMRGK